MLVVRLGEGVDRTGALSPAALERTRSALAGYVHLIHAHAVDTIRMVATSASRDASNAADFEEMVIEVLGQPAEVITGDEEARLSFTGAIRGLTREIELPALVVDIGGGSTEFVMGSVSVQAARSIDIGCVRMTERHLHSDPPTLGEIEAARADIDAGIDRAANDVPLNGSGSLIGLAGSITTVAAMALHLPRYDPVAIHGSVVPADIVGVISSQLLTMSRAERAEIPVMHPGRVDVIGAGALILHEVMQKTGIPEVVVSESDILDGIAWSLIDGIG